MNHLVELEQVKKYFPASASFFHSSKIKLRAVDNVSLNVGEHETFGLAGESGCGKTTLGRLILGVTRPTSGTVRFNNQDISFVIKKREMRRNVQAIPQDPYSSLNPRKTVGQILSKVLKFHMVVEKREVKEEVNRLLEAVELTPARSFMGRYPHELSGGQRQRVAIARAISVKPKLIVADEPVSALDMSIKAQILIILRKLQNGLGLTYFFITHDLSVMRSICDRIAIMYLGQIAEMGKAKDIFDDPLHPYTTSLIAATPVPDPQVARKRKVAILAGDVPSPINPPSGCRFHPRCGNASKHCSRIMPELAKIYNDHYSACHKI